MNDNTICIKHNGPKNLGRLGEELATGLLKNKGYQILFRNFQWKYGELDIVAKKDRILAFVEVKTRADSHYGTPAEAVTGEKRKKMERTAIHYMQRFGMNQMDPRLDVIEIKIEHTENI